MRGTEAESAIATTPDTSADTAPAWFPFAELQAPLDQLRGECASLNSDIRLVIGYGQATIDALIAETEQGFQRLRQAHAIKRELDDDQAARVLRGIREQARPPRPPMFHLAPLAERGASPDA